MKKILISVFTILAVSAATFGATQALFSDEETSIGNTFSAGTLDLTIDGVNDNVVKFNASNMRPGSQPHGAYTLKNEGSINGKLNLSDIKVYGGTLGEVVNVALFVDRDGNGWWSTGDVSIYSGKVSDIPSSITFNEQLNAGASTKIVTIFNWWSTPNDNDYQGESMMVDFTFELLQNL